jgi:hypothetical protein
MQLLHGFGERRRGRLIFHRQSGFLFTGHFRSSIDQNTAGAVTSTPVDILWITIRCWYRFIAQNSSGFIFTLRF